MTKEFCELATTLLSLRWKGKDDSEAKATHIKLSEIVVVWVFGRLKPIKLIFFTTDLLENGKIILFPSYFSRKFQGGQQHHCSTAPLVTLY